MNLDKDVSPDTATEAASTATGSDESVQDVSSQGNTEPESSAAEMSAVSPDVPAPSSDVSPSPGVAAADTPVAAAVSTSDTTVEEEGDTEGDGWNNDDFNLDNVTLDGAGDGWNAEGFDLDSVTLPSTDELAGPKAGKKD